MFGTQVNTLSVENDLRNLPIVKSGAVELLRQRKVDDSYIFEIEMAVDEAVTNAIQHAYPDKKGIIEITFAISDCEFTIQIKDYGLPLDPNKVKRASQTSNLEDRQIGGLGIHLMEGLMDVVRYEYDSVQKAKILTMSKRFETMTHCAVTKKNGGNSTHQ